MKTKDVPAIVMLLAGAVYCLMGIRDRVPLWDFSITLLIVLLIFYVLGGIIKIVLDKFMSEFETKVPEEDEDTEESEEDEEAAEKEEEEDSEEDAE